MAQRGTSSRKIYIFVDDIKNILSRLYAVTGAGDVEALAAQLNTPVSSVNGALRSKRILLSWLTELHAAKGISPIWILHGAGKVHCPRVYFDAEGLYSAWVE